MKRLVPLIGAVLALALSGTAAADTFTVVKPHQSRTVGFSITGGTSAVATGAMSFTDLEGIWQAAGSAYGIPWQVLAAINKVETNFGQNLGPSSAGAVGWMQFMPSTWARWGVDANGDGVADPNNPTDAIFSAARYLAACGGQYDIARAVYCYNHANWYVNDVLSLAAVYSRGGSSGLVSFDQLQGQLRAARATIATSKRQLVPALASARKLASAERKARRAEAKAHLLSDQLEAQKRVVQVGIRLQAADARVSSLRKRLDDARAQLGGLEVGLPTPGFAGIYDSAPGNQLLQSSQYGGVVSIAMQYLGVPYTWAGASPAGFDCSGLVQYVFAQVGIQLPHYTVSQWNSPDAVSVPQSELQPGDLVFFNGLDHVGIYIGDGFFIQAPHTGSFVRIDNLSERWYAVNYDGAKRIVGSGLDSFAASGRTMAFTTGSGAAAFTPSVVYFTR